MTEEEFLRIYDAQLPRLLGYCAFRLSSRQDAEDIAAETFARLLSRSGPSSQDRVSAWLFAVARNLCADHERRARHVGAMPTPPVEPSIEPVWTDFALRDALAILSPVQQQVFFLRAIQDLTFAEVGLLLGKNEQAVKMQYHRAVRRVRRELREVESCLESETEST